MNLDKEVTLRQIAEQYEVMFKTNLQDYLATGVEMKWVEDYWDSLKRHIEAVRTAGMRLGVPWPQLFVHDASKLSVGEFPYYARNFYGDKGDPAGYTAAWLHHMNHNPHHWEYWILRGIIDPEDDEAHIIDKRSGCLPMPNNLVREMVADWMGASKAYTGSWSIRRWYRSHKDKILLHPNTRLVLESVLKEINYGDGDQ